MTISYPDVRLKKELESLERNGYQVNLIMWQRGWPLQLPETVKVRALKLDAPTGDYRSIFYFPLWWAYLFTWLILMDWDVIHSVNLDTYFFGVLASRIKQKAVVYDIFDFYGDMMPERFRGLVVAIDRFLIHLADAVIIADDSRIEQIGGALNKEIITINNVPTADFNNKKNQHNSRDYFKIFIGGKIIPERCIHLVLKAVDKLDDVQLTIRGYCGDNNYKKQLLEKAQGKDNVDLYLEGVPYQDIVDETLDSDLTIALYDPKIPNNRYASPNKLFEAMASGIPIIVNEDTSMAHIVTQENCGLVIPYQNLKSLVESIRILQSRKKLHHLLGENGSRAYKDKYNWPVMEKRLLDIYDRIISTRLRVRVSNAQLMKA
ncbi:glycosyltransferase family 4 protein [Methanobacterium movens]